MDIPTGIHGTEDPSDKVTITIHITITVQDHTSYLSNKDSLKSMLFLGAKYLTAYYEVGLVFLNPIVDAKIF